MILRENTEEPYIFPDDYIEVKNLQEAHDILVDRDSAVSQKIFLSLDDRQIKLSLVEDDDGY